MVLTEAQAKALGILDEHGAQSPAQFARHMWPDSEGWRNHTKCGPSGVTRGGGMPLAAGCYLGKLARRGLVWRWQPWDLPYHIEYDLTQKGRTALQLWREAQGGQNGTACDRNQS